MQTVVMHVDGRGVVWAMVKCRVCGEVHKYVAAEVVSYTPPCKNCGRSMDIQGAVIAVSRKDQRRVGVLQPGEGRFDAD